MRSLSRSLVFLLILATSVAARPRPAFHGPYHDVPPTDVFSAASPDVRTKHLELDLEIDFEARQVRGSATHRIINFTGATQFIVDTNGLDIHNVTVDGVTAFWTKSATTPNGEALTIAVQPDSDEVRIEYSSRPTARALRWLGALQTRGRVAPSVHAQNQPDYARSWMPVQDSPAVRMTWEATLRVPPGLLALMSGGGNPTEVDPAGVYHFRMDRSVPAYLIVFTAGRYGFRAFDDRTGVYLEPELLDDGAYEMSFLPEMMNAAESILGPYPWGRYDLVFPPGFGGGMENPRLNFIGPDHIQGNGGAVVPSGLIAHELAHSWIGDMITCATWSDTWINEGGATYYTKRIFEAMGETELTEYGYYIDRKAFSDSMTGSTQPRLTTLHRDFQGTERPGNAFNTTAYQKGALFFKTLEDRLGREVFDAAMRTFFLRRAFSWVDAEIFVETFRETAFLDRPELEQELLVQEWVFEGGLPVNVTAPTRSALTDRAAARATAYRNGQSLSSLGAQAWPTTDVSLFLQSIPDLIPSRMQDLDSTFKLSSQKTPPVLWLVNVAKMTYPNGLPALEQYLRRGTSNSLAVWYELGRTASGKSWALALYPQVRQFYSPNDQQYIDTVIGYKAKIAA